MMTLSDLLKTPERPVPKLSQYPDYINIRLEARRMLVGHIRNSGQINNLLFRYNRGSIMIWVGRDFMSKRIERSRARHDLRPQFYEDDIQQL